LFSEAQSMAYLKKWRARARVMPTIKPPRWASFSTRPPLRAAALALAAGQTAGAGTGTGTASVRLQVTLGHWIQASNKDKTVLLYYFA
jgi:hypothetical protein